MRSVESQLPSYQRLGCIRAVTAIIATVAISAGVAASFFATLTERTFAVIIATVASITGGLACVAAHTAVRTITARIAMVATVARTAYASIATLAKIAFTLI